MPYTPVELRHVKIGRKLFGGYNRNEVDKILEDVADSFAAVWSERGELADKLEDVERVLSEVKQRESLLASTLVAAEKASGEVREAAKREAELIVAEAHRDARAVTRAAHGERERLFAEVRRIETLLRAALGMVEESAKDLPAAPLPEGWPKREETREFQAVQLPDEVDEQSSEEAAAGPWEDRDFAWG
jgi:cell division initiation protein